MPITKATASSIAPAAKGDLVVGSATNDAAVLAVGANGTTLVADSAEATGLKWATPSSGALTLINSSSLSGATSYSFNNVFTSTYRNYRILLHWTETATSPNTDGFLRWRFRASSSDNTTTNYRASGVTTNATTNAVSGFYNWLGGDNYWDFWTGDTNQSVTSGSRTGLLVLDLLAPQISQYTIAAGFGSTNYSTYNITSYTNCWFNATTQFDGMSLFRDDGSGNWAGAIRIYGYAD